MFRTKSMTVKFHLKNIKEELRSELTTNENQENIHKQQNDKCRWQCFITLYHIDTFSNTFEH